MLSPSHARQLCATVVFFLGIFSVTQLGGAGDVPKTTVSGDTAPGEATHSSSAVDTPLEVKVMPSGEPIQGAEETMHDAHSSPSRNVENVQEGKVQDVQDVTPFRTEDLLASKVNLSSALSDRYYEEVRAAQLELCGDLCTMNGAQKRAGWGKYMPTITAPVHCAKLYATDLFEASSPHWPPPEVIPAPLFDDYTFNRYVRMKYPNDGFLAQKYSGGLALASQWTQGLVNDMIQNVTTGRMEGNYGKANVHAIQRSVQLAGWKGKNVLVIGSENPWAEAILLSEGVGHVYTLEYGAINSTHPQLSTFTPHEFNRLYREGRLPRFQGMATFSSLEHSGLGRYGDVLNPWGDVVQMAKTWCILDPGSTVAVGVEGRVKGKGCGLRRDGITWNLHRKYGIRRFPLLFSNFETFKCMPGTTQPLFLAKRIGDKVQ